MNSNAYNEELKRAALQMIADDGFIIAQHWYRVPLRIVIYITHLMQKPMT